MHRSKISPSLSLSLSQFQILFSRIPLHLRGGLYFCIELRHRSKCRGGAQREATFQEDIIVYKGRGWTGPRDRRIVERHKLTHTRDPIYYYIGEHASSVCGDRVWGWRDKNGDERHSSLIWNERSRWTVRAAPRNRFRQVWELFARLPRSGWWIVPSCSITERFYRPPRELKQQCDRAPSYHRHYIFSFAIERVT